MSSRTPVTLTLLAALALAFGPVRGLQVGVTEWLGFLRVIAALIAAWGLARRAGWSRGLVTLLAVLGLWAAWSGWTLPVEFRALVPDYTLWRAGRVIAALLLTGAAAVTWAEHASPPRTA
jgi:hypothetical protein